MASSSTIPHSQGWFNLTELAYFPKSFSVSDHNSLLARQSHPPNQKRICFGHQVQNPHRLTRDRRAYKHRARKRCAWPENDLHCGPGPVLGTNPKGDSLRGERAGHVATTHGLE
jgi:hypothetical protein